MKTTTKKKILILLMLYSTILLSPKVKSDNNDINISHDINYEYVDYNDKRIIITTCDKLGYVYNKESNNVYILDCRHDKNSNFKIIDSYKITDKNEMERILNILLEYEKENPSSWNRSFNSMLNEWQAHNICYQLGYDIDSTMHVDLDNEDESKYVSKELTRFLGN